jgi:TRAP-type C4-dicarboxylate transport system substrate-binding protein
MKKNLWTIYLTSILIFSFFVLFPHEPGPAQVKPMVIKVADTGAETLTRNKAAKDVLQEIEKLSKGRVKHEIFWSEGLLKAKDILEGAKVGTCDVGSTPAMVYHPANFPIWQFTNLMFLGGNDIWGAMKGWEEMAKTDPVLQEELRKTGVKHLAFYGYPSTFMTRKPLAKLEDFKGVRMRSVGATAKWVSSVGGTAVPLTFYEVTEALARGTVDGTLGYLYAHYAYKFHDYCKYFLATPVANTCIINVFMNLNTWNKLPGDIQKIYEEAFQDLYPRLCAKYNDEDAAKELKAFKDVGVTTIELTPAEYNRWKESAKPLFDAYYEKVGKMGVDGKKIVADYEKLYKKHERKK